MLTRYGIRELAELGGVTRRTVRYYVQRGLLPKPTGTGRGKHYTSEHLERLVRIRRWQEAGVSLAEIHRRLSAPRPETSPGEGPGAERVASPPSGPTPASEGSPAPDRNRLAPAAESPGPRRDTTGAWRLTERWERAHIHAGVELHFRPEIDLSETEIERILWGVRAILGGHRE